MFFLYKAYEKRASHLSFRVDKWEFEFKAVDIFYVLHYFVFSIIL